MVLSGLTWEICLVYIDDIILVGRSFEEHLEDLSFLILANLISDGDPQNDRRAVDNELVEAGSSIEITPLRIWPAD